MSSSLKTDLYMCTALIMMQRSASTGGAKNSLMLRGVAFRPMKGEKKLLWEIWQKLFGDLIDCGGLLGPQWLFVMAIVSKRTRTFSWVREGSWVLLWQVQYQDDNL